MAIRASRTTAAVEPHHGRRADDRDLHLSPELESHVAAARSRRSSGSSTATMQLVRTDSGPAGTAEQVGERNPTARPLVERTSTSAPKQSSGPLVSAAGDALAMLPPIVPTFRVAGEPTIEAASAMAVQRSRMTG